MVHVLKLVHFISQRKVFDELRLTLGKLVLGTYKTYYEHVKKLNIFQIISNCKVSMIICYMKILISQGNMNYCGK